MKPLDAEPGQVAFVLRAFKTIAIADGKTDSRKQSFVENYQNEVGSTVKYEALGTITPQELRVVIQDPDLRLAIVQRMVIIALLDEEAHGLEIACLRDFAKTLQVTEPAIEQMKLAANGNVKRLAFDLLRHGFLARVFRNEWKANGLSGIIRGVKSMSGGKNEATAAKFGALRSAAPGTLGAHYIAYMDANQFPLPGEPKGAAEMLIFHDLGHGLTGFSTDVPGEMRMAGFEAGYMKDDGFGVIALALFGFHLGLPLPNIAACRGGFDWQAVMEGYTLGRKLEVDLRQWDPWPYMNRPRDTVQRELGMRN
jgi:hypothetical protein